MDIKKIIKRQKIRYYIIKAMSSVMPDKYMIMLQYRVFLKRKLHLKNPKRFTEKIQQYKLSYREPLMGICVDKYRVRNYVSQKGLDSILTKLYGVYMSGKNIDFSKLPGKFVLKTNNGSDGDNVIICRDKSKADVEAYRGKLDEGLRLKHINPGKEWAYDMIEEPCIMAEELLEDPDNIGGDVMDYKFFCFHGEPKVVCVDVARYVNHVRSFYDMQWNNMHVDRTEIPSSEEIPRPENLERMIEVASILSKDFPFVRVDLYNIKGKVYFGELTFYPWSGYVNFTPDSFDFLMGEMMGDVTRVRN